MKWTNASEVDCIFYKIYDKTKEEQLRIIFMWVKTDYINVKVFEALIKKVTEE